MIRLLISKQVAVPLLLLVSILTLSVLLQQFPSLPTARAAAADTINNSIKMTKQQSFVDSSGRLNVIGVVNNNGNTPVAVTVSLDTIGKSGLTKVMTDQTFGN